MSTEQQAKHVIVVNHEEQYSIWPVRRPLPAGWRTVEDARTEEACLDRITELWTDMRPLSLRHGGSDAR